MYHNDRNKKYSGLIYDVQPDSNTTFVTQLVSRKLLSFKSCFSILTLKAANTTIAEFANTVNPDYELSHQDIQCLPSYVFDFSTSTVFCEFADIILL